MDEIKISFLIEELKNKITNYQQILIEEGVGTKKFDEIFNEVIIMKKELELLLKLTPNNYNATMKNLAFIDNKYSCITNLTNDKLRTFLTIIDEYNSFINGYQQEIIIDESLNDFKEKALLSEVKISNLTSSSECAELLDLVNNMKADFMKDAEILKKQLSLIDFNMYNLLYLNVKNKTFSNLEVIKSFSNIDQNTLIAMIMVKKKELYKLKKSTFKTKKIEEQIESISKKILEREALLLQNINYYILNVISEIKRKLNIIIEDTKYSNFISLYYESLDKIDKKEAEYDKIIKNLKFVFEMFFRLEKGFKIKMNLIESNLYNDLKTNDIDISRLDLDRINSIKASINVYKKINGPSFKIEDEKSLKF